MGANAQKQWSTVGNAGFSSSNTDYNSIVVDSKGTSYVAFQDNANGNRATVMKYDGSNWVTVGNTGFSAGVASWVTLTISASDTLFIAFSDFGYAGGKARVMKYDGIKWKDVGNPGFSVGRVSNVSIALDGSSAPVVIYRDGNLASKATVKKYMNNSWTTLGSTTISLGYAYNTSIAIDSNDTPYVAFRDGNVNKVLVKKFNGTNWVTVGATPSVSSGFAAYTSLAIDANGVLYIAYQDGDNSAKATVKKFDGTNWVVVGSAGFSKNLVFDVSLDINSNGIPYVAYKDAGSGYKVTVMKYDGNSWVAVGPTGFSVSTVDYVTFTIDANDIPYVSYRDANVNNKATVMKYVCSYSEPKVDICAVTTDTITGKNTILWDKTVVPKVDSIKIYREDNGSYILVGSVLASSTNIYTDQSATPKSSAYKYKLIVLDSCEREGLLDSSTAHRTIRLKFDYLFNNEISLSWNRYEGISIPSYDVMRSNNGGAFIKVASITMSGSDTVYKDSNVPAGSNTYRIDVPVSNGCDVGSAIYNKVTSNEATAWATNVNAINRVTDVIIMPNPATNTISVSGMEKVSEVFVYDITGKLVHTKNVKNTNSSVTVDVSRLPKGTFFVKLKSASGNIKTGVFQKI